MWYIYVMNDQLKSALEVAQVRASRLSDAAQNLIASRLLEEIEEQERQEKSCKVANEDEVMKRFYEIEPQYSKLFEKLANYDKQ